MGQAGRARTPESCYRMGRLSLLRLAVLATLPKLLTALPGMLQLWFLCAV